jgi:CubicO group peptidase (beta-lactamase class C family)
LNGGELNGVRIYDPRTIQRATVEHSYGEIDFTLGLPFRYSLGFMLGAQWFSLYGPETKRAFGHLGFTNIISWADPERRVAATLMTSGKPLIYAEIYHVWNILRQIGLACPRESDEVAARRAVVVIDEVRAQRRRRLRAGNASARRGQVVDWKAGRRTEPVDE